MSEQHLEVLSIKRNHDSGDGQLLQFLREHEKKISGRGLTKIVLNTLRTYWWPFVLKRSCADKKDLEIAVMYSVSHLEIQISLLKHLLK